MGGSGGGGGPPRRRPPVIVVDGEPGGNGDEPPKDPCDLIFVTTLASVNRTAATAVVVNDELPLRLDHRQGVDIAVATTMNGAQDVGAINAAQTVQLIACMRAGRQYRAAVQSIKGPVIVVCVHTA